MTQYGFSIFVMLALAGITGWIVYDSIRSRKPKPDDVPVVIGSIIGPSQALVKQVLVLGVSDSVVGAVWTSPKSLPVSGGDHFAYAVPQETGTFTISMAGTLDGKIAVFQHTIEIIDGSGPRPPPIPPTPPTPPVPVPAGFAGEVAVKAAGLPPADCLALASNYETVSSMIAAGGITKLEEAVVKITQLNQSLGLDKTKWTPFATWLGPKFDESAQTLKDAQRLGEQVAVGLRYAGRKQ